MTPISSGRKKGLSRCASRPEPPTGSATRGRRAWSAPMCWWSGWGISTIRRTRCLWAAMWRLLCSRISRRRWRPTPGRSMISFPFNRNAWTLPAKPCARRPGISMSPCAGTPPKRGTSPDAPPRVPRACSAPSSLMRKPGCAPAARFRAGPRSAYGNSGLLICRRCSCGRA